MGRGVIGAAVIDSIPTDRKPRRQRERGDMTLYLSICCVIGARRIIGMMVGGIPELGE